MVSTLKVQIASVNDLTFLYVQSKKSLDPVKSCFVVLSMQHWLMSEGFPAQFYNWSFNRKKGRGGVEKNSYKLVSSQDGSFMFFRTFLTSFSKSLRALCSSSSDFFIFLLSCLIESEILVFGRFIFLFCNRSFLTTHTLSITNSEGSSQ